MIARGIISLGVTICAPMILAACVAGGTGGMGVTAGVSPQVTRASDAVVRDAGDGRVYQGIETRLLADDLVAFHVKMRAVQSADDVVDYAECAAAQYALIRGYGFARHLRTKTAEVSGLWQADAVYTISAALPAGLRTIDAEVTVSNCVENGIPTV